MTLLSAARSAALRCTGTVITSVLGSGDQIGVEMADLANDVGIDIARSHDWRALTVVYSGPGAAVTPLPDGYDRMIGGILNVDGVDPGYGPVDSLDDWSMVNGGRGRGWVLLDGAIQISPTPTNGVSFAYVSDKFVRADDTTLKSEFTMDSDQFVLDERLLTLGLIWRWKSMKGLEYAEDMRTYELALGQAQSRDRGTYALRVGGPTFHGRRAYDNVAP